MVYCVIQSVSLSHNGVENSADEMMAKVVHITLRVFRYTDYSLYLLVHIHVHVHPQVSLQLEEGHFVE